MPCDTSQGMGERTDYDAQRRITALEQRVAELEGAFCGLLVLLKQEHVELPPGTPEALRAWWEKHQRHPGHQA